MKHTYVYLFSIRFKLRRKYAGLHRAYTLELILGLRLRVVPRHRRTIEAMCDPKAGESTSGSGNQHDYPA